RPRFSRDFRFLADGSADDPPLSRRHSDRHPRDRVSGLRNSRGTSAKSVGELAPQHFSDIVQRGFSSSTELGILPDCAHDFYYGLRGPMGTLIGVSARAGFLDENGNLPQIERPMTVDALSVIFAALVGTSTSGAF